MKLSLTEHIRKLVLRLLTFASLVVCVVATGFLLYEFGFPVEETTKNEFHNLHKFFLVTLWIIITARLLLGGQVGKKSRIPILKFSVYIIFSIVAIISMLLSYNVIRADSMTNIFTGDIVVMILLLIVSFSEISAAVTHILSSHANPATILAGSFALIIFIGSLLLQLPNCTMKDINYIDSLFVATSAVCVTGLTPLDVSATFTTSGLIVLITLIQIGGLGLMTITSFFGLSFVGGSSLSNKIMVKELLSGESLSDLLRTLVKIISVTFCVEALGAIAIYVSIHNIDGIDNPFMFSVFHSISAFCNAGFSTLSGNLYDPLIRNIGSIMWIVSFLVICGGIGFPIFSNILSIIWHFIRNIMRTVFGIRRVHKAHLWNLNSLIVLKVTVLLLSASWGLFLALEWNKSLAEYDLWDKLAQGFMCAVTPRTAGFNGVDLTRMLPASIFLTIMLMWIGGAPQSTAGGVKVTTAYIAFKNIFSSAGTGREIEVHGRTIPNSSVRRAFAIMGLSLTVICVSVIILSLVEPGIELSKLIFEVVSAIGTVGLSLNVTPMLSPDGKILIIALMFIGRIGMITAISIFVRGGASKPYAYPVEDVLIN